jgi:hypothetical protein
MKVNSQNLKPFKKGDPRINRKGRPRKYTTISEFDGYDKTEVNKTITHMLAMMEAEITAVKKAPESTVLEKTVASVILKAKSYGDAWRMEQLLTRAFGSPTQKMDVNADVKHVITGMEVK